MDRASMRELFAEGLTIIKIDADDEWGIYIVEELCSSDPRSPISVSHDDGGRKYLSLTTS